MTYIPSLNKLQLGQEATLGTADTLDIQPNGLDVVINPKVEVEQLASKDGSTMPAKYSFVKRKWSEGSISGYLDYNRAMLWLDGLFTADDTSPHTYTSDEDSALTPKSMTLAYGQTDLIYVIEGVVGKTLTFSAATGEPWSFKYDWFGQKVADGGSFQSLTTDVPELVHGYETSLWMDEGLDATVGTTARADVAFRFEAVITANRKPIWHLGDQEWDSTVQGKWGGSFKLIMEADATNLDSLGDILDSADTGQGYTIRVSSTDGTNTMQLDFTGVCKSPPVLIQDTDGVVTIELDLVPQWNSTSDTCWDASLTIA